MSILEEVASAVRKVAVACSYRLGRDCIWHAMAAKYLLKKCGIESRIVIGFAAWRVGDSDGAVITHVPIKGVKYQPNEFPFHTWLELEGGWIFDVTTYLFKVKMKALDLNDNCSTQVDWCPDHLYIHKDYSKPLSDVIKRTSGLSYYEESKDVTQALLSVGVLDENKIAGDHRLLNLIIQNPSMEITNLNIIKGELNHG